MRVLVCGGRDYRNRGAVFDALNEMARTGAGASLVIQGGARGADEIAADWAAVTGTPVATYAADWVAHGRAAGPIRNKRMLDEGKPDLVLAFPGGRGTANMIKQARAAGVRVVERK